MGMAHREINSANLIPPFTPLFHIACEKNNSEIKTILFHIPEVSSSDIKSLDTKTNLFRLTGLVVKDVPFWVGQRIIFHIDGKNQQAIEVVAVNKEFVDFKPLD